MLKEAYIAIAGTFPTAVQELQGIQRKNFVVSNADTEVNLEDFTLDGDGNIIGIFVGRIDVSYGISGADTDINVVLNCHNDFNDNTSKDPVFELVRSKDTAADPIGDNFSVENIMATEVVIDGATNGDFSLHFDGYIVPVTPYSVVEQPENVDFGIEIKTTETILEVPVVATRLTGNLVISVPSGVFTMSTASDGIFGDSVELEPDADGNIDTVIFVKFTPDNEDTFSETVTLSAPGAYIETFTLSGEGVVGDITINPTSIDFGQRVENTSTVDTFTVSAVYLLDDLLINADLAGAFTLSLDPEGEFTDELVLTPDENGTVEETTIYVKFIPPSVDTFTDGIQLTSDGTTDTATMTATGEGVSA